jgi:acetyltransferase-like isoleucine patch superfamily enzyme
MIIERFVRSILKRIRGKDIAFAPELPPLAVFVHALQKGFMPCVRGMIAKPFLGQTKGLVFLGRGCRILSSGQLTAGKSLYIGDYAYIDCLSSGGVNIGDNVTIREGCWLQLTSRYDNPGTSITIGNSVYIGPRATLGAAAPLTIGDRSQIGANVSFIAENHQFDGIAEIFEQGVTRKGIMIGRDVWIGNNAVILDGVSVGDGTVIGAGTVVTKSLPARSVAVGVPARVVHTR